MNDTSIIFSHPGFIEIAPKIWVIKNFLTEEECAPFVYAGENATEEDWGSSANSNDWYVGKILEVSNIIDKDIIEHCNNKFKNLFVKKDEYFYGAGVRSIKRLSPGEEMFTHCDFQEIDTLDPNIYNIDDIVLFNSTISFNDFEGGEVFFPEFNLKYKPERGDIMMFPGTRLYTHSVLPVVGTTVRYSSTSWTANKIGLQIKTSGLAFNTMNNN